jgi:hypothetical protein
MNELASSSAGAADAASDLAEHTGTDARAPAFHVLVGRAGLAAGLFGAVVVAVTTVAWRWLEVPFLYARPQDATLHLALEVAWGAALWLVLWAVFNAALELDRRVSDALRRSARLTTLVVGGVAVGLLVYFFVVSVSPRSRALPPALWILLLGAGGAVMSLSVAALLRARVRRARAVGWVVLGVALGLHLYALERYVRHYGNLQAIVGVSVSSLGALGVGLAVGGQRLRGNAGRFAWGALATSVLWIALLGAQPSYSSRRAVLVWGGIAKRALLSVVWPLCDRDGDGAPGLFWGADPDDRRADVTPRSGSPLPARSELVPLGARFAPGPHRNLLWITVDTVRRDSFDAALAARPDIASALSAFADYKGYASCSSRTAEVMAQLVGSRRCDPRVAEGLRGHSLLEMLRGAGYRDRLVTVFEPAIPLAQMERYPDDTRALARAGQLLDAADGEALFVHLRGGHGDYDEAGRTPRERYDNQLRASLAGVAALVRSAPAERWAVVVLGDHGEAFGEHVSMGHATTLYEEALRTPLLVRAPNVASGPREQRASCDSVAWFALHAMGLIDREPAPLPVQYALLDIAPGELGHLQGDHLRALRVGSNKAIWSSDLGLFELYDLDADPGELHSLAESHPAELAPLRVKLEELGRDCPRQ